MLSWGSIKVPSYRVVVVFLCFFFCFLLKGLKPTQQSLWSTEPSLAVSHRMTLLPCFTSFSSSVDGQVSFQGRLLQTRSPLMCTAFMFRFPNTVFQHTFKIPPNHLSQTAVHLQEKEIFASKTRIPVFRNKTGGKNQSSN